MMMREKMTLAIIERWHPGAMARSYAENHFIIVPPTTLLDAQSAADAVLDALMEPTDGMLEATRAALTEPNTFDLDASPEQIPEAATLAWQAMIRAARAGK